MKNTFCGIFVIGLLLISSSNIFANPNTDCKPTIQIQPIKGNYTAQLNGDIEKLEAFLTELATQNVNYCNASLRVDFIHGLETKQTISKGQSRYNEKLSLEIQYYSPYYKAELVNVNGDVLHQVALGKELKSLEYSNPKLKSHDALYAEWRKIRRKDFSQIENDANSLQALIDFLKNESGMKNFDSTASTTKTKKNDVLIAKGKSKNITKKENRPSKKPSILKQNQPSTSTTSTEKPKQQIVKSENRPSKKPSISKQNQPSTSTTSTEKSKQQIVKSENRPSKKPSISKQNQPSTSTTSTEKSKQQIVKSENIPAKTPSTSKSNQPNKLAEANTQKELVTTEETIKEKPSPISSEPREIISDDDMFGAANVTEPLAEFIRFDFYSSKKYRIINDGEFSLHINSGRKGGKIFAKNLIAPGQDKTAKNKFKRGDWYSIIYTEKLHQNDIKKYKESIEDILSELKLSDYKDDFEKLSDQLIPNLDIITNENPLASNLQKQRVEKGFQKLVEEKGIEILKNKENQEAKSKIKSLMTLIIQSHQLFHYYKYTVGSSAAQRPVNEISNFRNNY